MNKPSKSESLIELPKGLQYPVRIQKCHVARGQQLKKSAPLYTIEDSTGKKGIMGAPFDCIVQHEPVEEGAAFGAPIAVLTVVKQPSQADASESKQEHKHQPKSQPAFSEQDAVTLEQDFLTCLHFSSGTANKKNLEEYRREISVALQKKGHSKTFADIKAADTRVEERWKKCQQNRKGEVQKPTTNNHKKSTSWFLVLLTLLIGVTVYLGIRALGFDPSETYRHRSLGEYERGSFILYIVITFVVTMALSLASRSSKSFGDKLVPMLFISAFSMACITLLPNENLKKISQFANDIYPIEETLKSMLPKNGRVNSLNGEPDANSETSTDEYVLTLDLPAEAEKPGHIKFVREVEENASLPKKGSVLEGIDLSAAKIYTEESGEQRGGSELKSSAPRFVRVMLSQGAFDSDGEWIEPKGFIYDTQLELIKKESIYNVSGNYLLLSPVAIGSILDDKYILFPCNTSTNYLLQNGILVLRNATYSRVINSNFALPCESDQLVQVIAHKDRKEPERFTGELQLDPIFAHGWNQNNDLLVDAEKTYIYDAYEEINGIQISVYNRGERSVPVSMYSLDLDTGLLNKL